MFTRNLPVFLRVFILIRGHSFHAIIYIYCCREYINQYFLLQRSDIKFWDVRFCLFFILGVKVISICYAPEVWGHICSCSFVRLSKLTKRFFWNKEDKRQWYFFFDSGHSVLDWCKCFCFMSRKKNLKEFYSSTDLYVYTCVILPCFSFWWFWFTMLKSAWKILYGVLSCILHNNCLKNNIKKN